MNKIYKVIWNQSLKTWTVASELAAGTVIKTAVNKPNNYCNHLVTIAFASALSFTYTDVFALSITDYTRLTSSQSISDGLLWQETATVQVDRGADITVSGAEPVLDMNPAKDIYSSLWVNGGTLNTAENSTTLLGKDSLLQIGGAHLGGLTSTQNGGSGGNLVLGKIKTDTGSDKITLWMFGSDKETAKLHAGSILFNALNNEIWLQSGDNALGADISVDNDMKVINGNRGYFTMVYSKLDVGGDLYLDTSNGSMLITENHQGITIDGDFTIKNTVHLTDINGVSLDAGIYSTPVTVGNDMKILGEKPGYTGLQIINAYNDGISVKNDIDISSMTNNNETSVIFGHSSKVSSEGNINLSSVQGGKTNLFIGDKTYGSPDMIIAKKIVMSGGGENGIIFNGTRTGKEFNFYTPITGVGRLEHQSGRTNLYAISDYTGNTSITGGMLSLYNYDALGNNHIYINSPPSVSDGLKLSEKSTDTVPVNNLPVFDNTISGAGNVHVDGHAKIVSINDDFTGDWHVIENGILSQSLSSTTTRDNFGLGNLYLSNNAELHIVSDDDFTVNNKITSWPDGDTKIYINNNGNNLNFEKDSLDYSFFGELTLSDNHFLLSGDNTEAVSGTKLILAERNITTVGQGEQNIRSLEFDGGRLKFTGVTPGKISADGMINASDVSVSSGAGEIQVDTDRLSNDRPQPDMHIPLLQQDDADIMISLIKTEGNVSGDANDLILLGKNGEVISDAVIAEITQQGNSVARGTYDYRLTTGPSRDGIYINYGLKTLDLIAKGNKALILDANGNGGNAADMSARITGSGDLAFDSQKGQTVTLSDADNDYSGMTDVRGGNLAMLNDNVLGNTSILKLAPDTGFDMRGNSQHIGRLSAENGSLLDLNSGHLTLLNGGESAAILAGDGKLTVAGGLLNVTGANDDLKATTVIARDATTVLNNPRGLGKGDIIVAGELNLNNASGELSNNISDTGETTLHTSDINLRGDNRKYSGTFKIDNTSSLTVSSTQHLGEADIQNSGKFVLNVEENWLLKNSITGDGDVIKNGSGNLMLDDSARWTGTTNINAGTLILGSLEDSLMLGSRQVNINKDARLSGFGGVTGNIDNQGTLSPGDDTGITRSIIDSPLSFTVGGNLVNSGNIRTGSYGKPAGNQLIVNGDYHGRDGWLYLNTVLGDDNSASDKLVVKGNTSGITSVRVTNAGGSGAQTLNGIKVIHVDGQSDGTFIQAGRIVAGAYDYSLVRGQGDNDRNWYLTSHKTGGNSGEEPGNKSDNIRPESASYTANLAAANSLFVTRLHDRLGETQYTDVLTGEKKVTSMWMRQVGGHNRWRDGSGQLKTQSNRYIMQIGGDVARWSGDGLDRWHLGVMAGYGHDSNNTRSSSTGYRSDSSVNGYSAGIYATWYANDESHQGTYLDTWAQYNWFNNDIKGQDIQSESYKSRGITGSLELGYTHKLNEFVGAGGAKNEWFIQPQAQAVWMGVKSDKHREAGGTFVSSDGDGNIQTRLGVRTYLKGHSTGDDGKGREFEPFVEINWLHNTKDFSTTMNGVNVSQEGARNIGEIKTGVEGQITPNLSLWGNVGIQAGDKGYSNTVGMLGIKYSL
ncbi:autotransporter outer membrane beta-barrel domain-containing protein [Escherichia coli]|uniref:autotransporter outer membrane beta-barrel domain-containing protein n=3 Tax=Escherichia TaxID=561 RepID=UPI001C8BED72|nr:autotransporter outer membrane beta-barrel domain-containing protein [Escherichia coli]MBX8955869.1 autotransporter outer membrane beta-barrel domain-containing protein [Escherichia coli]